MPLGGGGVRICSHRGSEALSEAEEKFSKTTIRTITDQSELSAVPSGELGEIAPARLTTSLPPPPHPTTPPSRPKTFAIYAVFREFWQNGMLTSAPTENPGFIPPSCRVFIVNYYSVFSLALAACWTKGFPHTPRCHMSLLSSHVFRFRLRVGRRVSRIHPGVTCLQHLVLRGSPVRSDVLR